MCIKSVAMLTNITVLVEVVEKEVKYFGGDRSKVFVGGFSQGAAMTLDFYLKQQPRLGGCFALSGFLFPQLKFNSDTSNNIIATHCHDDQVLNFQLCMKSYEPLKSAKGTFQMFEMKGVGHSISLAGIKALRKFFKKLI